MDKRNNVTPVPVIRPKRDGMKRALEGKREWKMDSSTSITKVLKRNYRKAINSIDQLLTSNGGKFTVEEIHQLRVGIKKIKASLGLLSASKKDFDAIRYFKPFKTLFSKAGKLRTIQVEQSLMKQYGLINGNNVYLRELQQAEQRNRESFRKSLRPGVIKNLERKGKQIQVLLDEVEKDDIHKYLSHEFKRLNKTIRTKVFNESKLHVVRKRLKNFFLNAKGIVPKAKLGRLNKLQDLLGKWHDRQITFNELVKVVSICRLKPSEVRRLSKIKTKLLAEKEKLFDRIVTDGLFRPGISLVPG